MYLARISLWSFIGLSLLASCGDSYNSRLYQGSLRSATNIGNQCQSGCYGIPKEWYDKGIVVKKNGEVISKPDPKVKIQGECYFKVCLSDSASPYTQDAKDWVNQYGGAIINETDPLKCANLNTSSIQIKTFEYIDLNKSPDC